MRLPQPCVSQPNLLACAVFHSEPSLPRSRAGSSHSYPVAGSTAVPEKRVVSASAMLGGGGLRLQADNMSAKGNNYIL